MEFNGTFLASILSFIIFVFAMNKLLYAPIAQIVKQREDLISENLQYADENNKKASELAQERNDKLDNAKNEARAKYLETVEGFKDEKGAILNNAKGEADKELAEAYSNLNNLSDEVKASLKSRMTELAGDISEKILGYRSEIKNFDNEAVDRIFYQ